jgi:hypothetical protein
MHSPYRTVQVYSACGFITYRHCAEARNLQNPAPLPQSMTWRADMWASPLSAVSAQRPQLSLYLHTAEMGAHSHSSSSLLLHPLQGRQEADSF